jgi:hypothetical protein
MNLLKSVVANWYKRVSLLWRKERYDAKVFCIGYNKTGTTTLGKSFEMLGLRNTSFNQRVWRELYKKGRIKEVLVYTAKFDSTDDLPWLKTDMIPLLDETFPGSKFVYLFRDEDSWKKSLKTWSEKAKGRTPEIEAEYRGYLAHQEFVQSYFRDWPVNRFISLSISDEMGFKKLAKFLGKPSVADSFPRFNQSKDIK